MVGSIGSAVHPALVRAKRTDRLELRQGGLKMRQPVASRESVLCGSPRASVSARCARSVTVSKRSRQRGRKRAGTHRPEDGLHGALDLHFGTLSRGSTEVQPVHALVVRPEPRGRVRRAVCCAASAWSH